VRFAAQVGSRLPSGPGCARLPAQVGSRPSPAAGCVRLPAQVGSRPPSAPRCARLPAQVGSRPSPAAGCARSPAQVGSRAPRPPGRVRLPAQSRLAAIFDRGRRASHLRSGIVQQQPVRTGLAFPTGAGGAWHGRIVDLELVRSKDRAAAPETYPPIARTGRQPLDRDQDAATTNRTVGTPELGCPDRLPLAAALLLISHCSMHYDSFQLRISGMSSRFSTTYSWCSNSFA
jgi:hypothetical protein